MKNKLTPLINLYPQLIDSNGEFSNETEDYDLIIDHNKILKSLGYKIVVLFFLL